ncbi:MFS transporter [Thermicanus aegyptius]|uniref:MFS transporter n=1 Tax=Thermicanus aegyptius TaxID=94009 RepID=UPI000693203F|nr:MFS transporter [Thermicanus aegyptius]
MENSRYYTLVFAVIASGISQGLLLSLLAIILEEKGLTASANSLNAIAIYIGVLLSSPFMERPVKMFGYKWALLLSLAMMGAGAILFPVWENFLFWMGLRFLVGVGDSLLHFATQTWILTTTKEAERGMKISFYGFSYGLGFGIGPLGINLYAIHPWFPFLFLFLSYLIVAYWVFRLKNEFPHPVSGGKKGDQRGGVSPPSPSRGRKALLREYKETILWGWFALLPAFLYGYLESTLNNNFPVYALREGITPAWISLLLPAFIVGGLLFQIPLGIWSDRWGRKRMMVVLFLLGGMSFLLIPIADRSFFFLLFLFFISGSFVGSSYSLGLAFAADLLPRRRIAKANILSSLLFGVGSIIGAGVNGLMLEHSYPSLMFYFLGALYLFTGSVGFFSPSGRGDGSGGQDLSQVERNV